MKVSFEYLVPVAEADPIQQELWTFNQRRTELWERKAFLEKILYVVRRCFVIICNECVHFTYWLEGFFFLEGECRRFSRLPAFRRLFPSYADSLKAIRNGISSVTRPLFTDERFFPKMVSEITHLLKLNKQSQGSLASFVLAYLRVKVHSSVSPLKKGWNLFEPFDPVLLGNLPYPWKKIEIQGAEACSLIRMPTATRNITADASRVCVTEDFVRFIQGQQALGLRHVYVNLMSKSLGTEGIRTRALRDFAGTVPGTLCFISLDKNSPFYLQTETPPYQEWKDFFDDFRENMQDTKLYDWPPDFPQEFCDQAISDVCASYKGTSVLSRNERAVLIELVHTKIIQKVVDHYKPRTMNISCLNCIDRGIAQQLQFVAQYLIQRNEEVLTAEFYAMAFAPAYLVSNRTMQNSRFTRLVSVLDRMLQKSGSGRSTTPS